MDLETMFGTAKGGVIGGLFARMEIAEEAIKAARLSKAKGSRAFGAACPSPVLRGKGDDLYRAHLREIIARVKKGQDLRPATDAECLAALSDTSLAAPLTAGAQAAMEALFGACFPAKGKRLAREAGASREPWAGRTAELIVDLRKKLAVEDRGVRS